MQAPPQFTVYISSTFNDLAEERKAAIDIVRQYAVVLDSCRASEQGVAAACAGDVLKCNLYVGIVAKRYGYRPPGADNPEDKSITEIEYDACKLPGRPPIDRLIFVKTVFDEETSDNPSERIDAFRKRVREDQTAFPFKDLGAFRLALDRAVREARERFLTERFGRLTGVMGGAAPRADLLRPIALAKLTGTDDAVLAGATDTRFHVFDSSADDPQWLARLDSGLHRAHVGCLLVTPAGVSRLTSAPAVERVAAAIAIGVAAARPLTLVLAGVDAGALPQTWLAAPRFEVAADAFAPATTGATLDALYQHLRARQPDLSPLPRLALPYVVLAPTDSEIEALCAPDLLGFAAYDDEDERADRVKDFERVAAAARLTDASWPAGLYFPQREQWRCFGRGRDDVETLLLSGVERINNAADGTRERRLMGKARIIPRAYRIEELLDDRHGSGSALLSAVQRGGLVIIDEFALLQPQLRGAAKRLLGTGRTAVVSISACDPAHSPTRRLLGDRSFLRVGALLTRFADEYDPRCELAVNSVERLQRWLRLAVPDLLAAGEAAEPQADLVNQIWA